MARGGSIGVDRRARKARHKDVARLAPPGGNDLRTQPGVGGEHAVEANEMEPWTGDERGQPLHNSSGDITMWVVPSR